ncbi:MAG: DUF885 family protein [Pseudomonadota bacterium]|nr:DUF885 family protein [Pseudomonadota bacterium]
MLVAAAVPAAPLPAQPAQAAEPASADERLRRLYTEEFRWRMEQEGRVPGENGRWVAGDRLPQVDAAAQRERLAYWTRVLAELDRIPLDQLSPEERENAMVFRTVIEEMANEVQFRTYEAPLNADTFFWGELRPYGTLSDAEAYRRYLGRLRDIPRYFDEQMANMRAGLARGFSVPRVSLEGRDRTIEPYLAADETNPLWAPFAAMPSSIPAAEQERLRAEARAALREAVVPAYRELLTMFREEYLPRTRTTLAAYALPDGRDYYQAMIRGFTTLDMTPEQIHRIGLSEVARIRAEMEATMRRAEFEGTLPEFIHFLRTDPQFYASSPRELLAFAAYVVKKADGALSETIGTLPRYRHGIVPVPEAIAPIYTAGRGGLENCMFNTWNLPARPLYAIPALALHECTPGHSFQAALALEAPERPDFRRELYFSGYGEGWGLYVEWLGTVMGIYETPYEDFGRLTYEMWRAARLVIDTGIHAFGWTRDQALAYLRDNTALSEHEITTEIDRYISWPGQALAYKLGELQIRRHRAEAEAALGERFDQRAFHDAILALGSVPLPVLEERMDRFIAEARREEPGAAR